MLWDLRVSLQLTHDGANHGHPKTFEKLQLCADEIFWRKPVVFLHRDPRDTAVSGFFQKSFRRDGYHGNVADFIRDPLHGLEKIVRYNLTWLERGNRLPAFLPITYENLRRNPHANLRTILDFVGAQSLSDAVVARALTNNTLENMRQRESLRVPKQSFKARRGKVGGYVDYLSIQDLKYCNDILQQYDYFSRVEVLSRGLERVNLMPEHDSSGGGAG
jgi:hypothetical protein